MEHLILIFGIIDQYFIANIFWIINIYFDI